MLLRSIVSVFILAVAGGALVARDSISGSTRVPP